MTEALVLALPDFNLPFTLETDASDLAMSAVLMQNHHPIVFFNKPFCPRLQHASTYVHELYAIVVAVRKWCLYLLGHSFIILIDHKSLKELIAQVIQTPEQQVYLSKPLGPTTPSNTREEPAMLWLRPFPGSPISRRPLSSHCHCQTLWFWTN